MTRIESAALLEDGTISVVVSIAGLQPPRGVGGYKIAPTDSAYLLFKSRFGLKSVGNTSVVKLKFHDKSWIVEL